MSQRLKKKPDLDELTVGTIVESLKPSHLHRILTTLITLVVFAGTAGFTVSSYKSDLDMKAHVLKDNEEHIIDLEKQQKYQRDLESLKAEIERLKEKHVVAPKESKVVVRVEDKK